MKKTFIII